MELLQATSSPHIRAPETTTGVMRDVLIALLPTTAVGLYNFGLNAGLLVILCVASSVLFEYVYQKMMKQTVSVNDLSAAVTGLILALNLPSNAPLWIAPIGSFFAIIIVKQLFGGLGQNFMNPAMGARVFLVVSYPTIMTRFVDPITDAISQATPLAIIKTAEVGGAELFNQLPSLKDSFLGFIPGTIGETSTIALLIGLIYLLVRKIITWHIPVIYIGGVFGLTFLLNGFDVSMSLYSVIAGGVFLGGIFMLTDYATSPMNRTGQIIYAFGAALITVLIRVFGGYNEGVMFSVLLMNMLTPMIEHYTAPRVFGTEKRRAN
ncbi:MAG: RnfABCDGE type electron transport complex subunit D [Tissierellia bacterium]|jgi:electron transport complex protein RnfD|nr:RnfABCDGE type electron transport complex subunit D [Bacillota bacterium]NLL23725.1 RnfABCDGE type electron transport complex subunit D [Tissierellia bacterium]